MTSETARTVIGTGHAGFLDTSAAGPESPIAEPFGVVIGPDAALYFCDLGNHRIRRVDLEKNEVATVAGTGAPGYSGDGGPAIEAQLDGPYEIRFDAQGNLVFVDMPAHVVRRIDRRTGMIDSVAGSGEAGFSGDGGPATRARLTEPHSIEFGPDGALYIADILNHRIRRVDPETGSIETFAGTGEQTPTRGGAPLRETALNGPRALAFDEAGDLHLALREGNSVHRIDMQSGSIHHVAGTTEFGYAGDGGDARLALLSGPKGISVDASGIYIADTESHTIRRIDRASGVIETVMGDGSQHDGPDGHPLSCGLARPHGVFVLDRFLYVGDTDNHRVRAMAL